MGYITGEVNGLGDLPPVCLYYHLLITPLSLLPSSNLTFSYIPFLHPLASSMGLHLCSLFLTILAAPLAFIWFNSRHFKAKCSLSPMFLHRCPVLLPMVAFINSSHGILIFTFSVSISYQTAQRREMPSDREAWAIFWSMPWWLNEYSGWWGDKCERLFLKPLWLWPKVTLTNHSTFRLSVL